MHVTTFSCRLLLICVSALALHGLAHAQWKWRDARGQIQYSDVPPPKGTPEKDVLLKPRSSPIAKLPSPEDAASAPEPAASASGVAEDPLLAAKRKQIEREAAAKRKADEERVAQVRQQSCERARAYLRTLDSGQRLTRTNDKGEREVLDDRARARESAQARQAISSECR